MEPRIITTNDRGQLTLPKFMRDQVGTRHFKCYVVKGNFVLEPIQTRDEFLEECEAAYKDYKKNGGYTLDEMRKRHGL